MLRRTAGHQRRGRQRGGSGDRAGNTRTDSAHNRYNIAPQELIRIQRQGRERGLDIVGFYHSHPDHPAQWSKTDFEEAHWIGCCYVITSVEKGTAKVTNAFLLTGTAKRITLKFHDESERDAIWLRPPAGEPASIEHQYAG